MSTGKISSEFVAEFFAKNYFVFQKGKMWNLVTRCDENETKALAKHSSGVKRRDKTLDLTFDHEFIQVKSIYWFVWSFFASLESFARAINKQKLVRGKLIVEGRCRLRTWKKTAKKWNLQVAWSHKHYLDIFTLRSDKEMPQGHNTIALVVLALSRTAPT